MPPSLVLLNGRVHTLEGERPPAAALACRGDRIFYVGDSDGVRGFIKADTQVIDLQGATAVPGLTDAHLHLLSLGYTSTQINLADCADRAAVFETIRAFAAAHPSDAWLLGRGWDQTRWTPPDFPTAADLDAVASDRPCWLMRLDGHTGWANTAALHAAGITAATADPAGGKIVRDATGAPAGVLVDTAMELLRQHIPPPTAVQRRAALAAGQDLCLRVGLTCVHDAWSDLTTLGDFRAAEQAGDLRLRIYAMVAGPGEDMKLVTQDPPRVGDGMLTIRCVKLFTDGALGSRGAALSEPYSDDPGNTGLFLNDEDTLREAIDLCLARGYQVATHAIGDRANRRLLDLYERALTAHPHLHPRLRAEHAQVLAPADIPRFGQLGVLCSIQPIHQTEDMRWAEARLGPERIAGAYAWRSLKAAGALLIGGSDAPVASVSPAHGMHAAVTRQDAHGGPPGGWRPQERLTARQALDAYTTGAAYAAFEEEQRGTLAVGKRADVTVFDQDPLGVEPSALRDLKVRWTIVGGHIQYNGK